MTTTSDLVYGRQGGRFTVNRGDAALTEIHHQRLAMIADGTWPTWADEDWHARAADARRRGDVSGAGARAIETARALTKAGRGPATTSAHRGHAA